VNINTFICTLGLGACLFSGQTHAELNAEDLQAMFDRAILTRESGKTFEAIELFETILTNQPTLNRVRLELAVAYHQATRYEDALHEFKRVLDDPATPENVKLSILAYLGQLTSDELEPAARHSFSYYTKVGLLHNSNINATPGAGLSNITGINTAEKISSAGADINLSVSHRYNRKSPLDIQGVATYFEWQSQLGLTSNLYSKTNDFDYSVISLSTGPAFIAPGRWRASISFRADQISLGGSTLAIFSSINPAITFDFGHYRNLTLESAYTHHSYDKIADLGRDGNETMFGAGYNTLVNDNSTGLEAGFRLRQNDAEEKGYAYDDTELYFSGFTALSDQAVIYLRINRHNYAYDAVDPLVSVIRDETENLYALGYNRDFHEGTLKDWTFNLEFSATSNDSNAAEFEYDRNLFSTSLSRYFQ
jgi:tetratricopeptide (TPR) repeat protein